MPRNFGGECCCWFSMSAASRAFCTTCKNQKHVFQPSLMVIVVFSRHSWLLLFSAGPRGCCGCLFVCFLWYAWCFFP